MNKINPYFITGSIGILMTSILQIGRQFFLDNPSGASFSILYPIFLGFLIIGTYVMIKKKKQLRE